MAQQRFGHSWHSNGLGIEAVIVLQLGSVCCNMCTRIAWHVGVIHGLGLCVSEVIFGLEFQVVGQLVCKVGV